MTIAPITSPIGLKFEDWAQQVLIDTNVQVVEASEEKNWENWARSFMTDVTIASYGVPDPKHYMSWRNWAQDMLSCIRS